MTSIITRAGKGAPLSWNEADANFTNLNNDKIEAASPSTLTNKTVNLTSNTLTGTKAQFDTACSDDNFAYVGQANTFTQDQTISSGNLSLSGTGQRITGDFSNTTIANRVMFQTSTVNSNTAITISPNGTNKRSEVQSWTGSTANESAFTSGIDGSAAVTFIASDKIGTGTYLPMTFYIGGSERMRIDTSGNVGIGGVPSGSRKLEVISSGTATDFWVGNTNGFGVQTHWDNISGYGLVCTVGGYPLKLGPNSTAVLSIDNNANTLHIHPNGGLGYGTGAGGTVTQATSKSTAVTLNKPTGRITMHNAAIPPGVEVGFTLINSLLQITDNLLITVNGDTPNYWVYRVRVISANGAALIYVKNEGGSSVSDAVALNFAVIKGATA